MERLFPTTHPVRAIEGGLDILATHDEDGPVVFYGVGEMGCVVDRRKFG